MIRLPNGCYCSDLSIYPANWKTGGTALLKLQWRIAYYFHDPLYKDRYPKGKYVIVKGMNRFERLPERRQATQELYQHELDQLQIHGWNPITKQHAYPQDAVAEIDPETGFIEALKAVKDKMQVGNQTKLDLTSVIKYTSLAAVKLRLASLPVRQIRRKHIKQILDLMPTVKKKWSANQFNYYRAHLSMLFTELLEYEAVETNPVKDIKKQKHLHTKREVLTMDERKAIDKHLPQKHYGLWRYMHIFFHSGCRKAEMHRLKVEDVKLETQRFKVIIKKGRTPKEEWRPIKNIVKPLWEELLAQAKPGDYLFSRGLMPGPNKLVTDRVSKLWLKYVKGPKDKDGLGIDKDFYSLKHSNLDETAALLSVEDAANMAGHTTPVITIKHYLVNEEERKLQRLQQVNNAFS